MVQWYYQESHQSGLCHYPLDTHNKSSVLIFATLGVENDTNSAGGLRIAIISVLFSMSVNY